MQQCRIIYCSLAALYVSNDIFAHHQEHQNLFTVAPDDDERKYRSKYEEQPRDNKLPYTVASC